jgi:uncharacterized membrane protein (UPF0127 family)
MFVQLESKKMIYFVLSIFIIAVIGMGIVIRLRALSAVIPQHYLEINGTKIALEIADTDATRTLGLSNRASLQENTGMLFIFPKADYWGFWMKDMHFPLDIIFLDSTYKVITIFKNVQPNTFPALLKPEGPATYVLEVNAGFVVKNRILHQEQLKIK